MPELTINASDYAIRLAREGLLAWGGALDAKRPQAWQQYGYPDVVTFEMLRRAYDRTGAGKGAVDRLVERCWMRLPRVKRPESDDETPAEKAVAKALKMARVWLQLRELDRRALIGHYAGLIYRMADGKALSEPLDRAEKLVELVPLSEHQLKVTRWDEDRTSPTFGQPLMWQYRARTEFGVDAVQGRPEEWADVHPSRVQVMAEGVIGGDFFNGTPLLKAGYNNLVDLEKISGGSAESFLKNSARTVVLKFEPGSNPHAITENPDGTPTGLTVGQAAEEKFARLNRNIDAAIVTQGGDATTLQTQIADPTGAWTLAANLFAASVRIPFTILFGQQTGRLASDEDKADFNARCSSRQANQLTPAIEEFIRRMQACGVIEAGEFEVEWKPLDAPGDAEKADLLGKMTAAMKQAFDAGLTEPLFDANELRGTLDFEPRADDGMPEEGEGQPEEDPAAPVPLRGVRQPAQLPQPKRA